MLGRIDGFGGFSIADWWPFRVRLLGGTAVAADEWAKAHDEFAPVLVMPDINGSLLADTDCVDRSMTATCVPGS